MPEVSRTVPGAQLVRGKNDQGIRAEMLTSNHEAVTPTEGGVGQGGAGEEVDWGAGLGTRLRLPSNLTAFGEAR